MNTQPENYTFGRAILIGILTVLILLIAALVGIGIFGSQNQFEHAKELLPLLISLTTPLLAAGIGFYLQRKP